jgi:hypothetical protein
MTLSAQEVTKTFFSLPEQEQQAAFDFMEFLKEKSAREQTKRFLEKLGKTETTDTESEMTHLSENYKGYLWGSDKPNKPLKLGLFKGQIKMSDDFNEPLPDSFWLEGKL